MIFSSNFNIWYNLIPGRCALVRPVALADGVNPPSLEKLCYHGKKLIIDCRDPMVNQNYSVQWITNIQEIPESAWDALAQPLLTPFLEWEWLHNLEVSKCAQPREGWQPCHLVLWNGDTIAGAAPLYVKGHSYGEFVFDYQWADLSHRLGLNYYPKLLGMTPFTPATGYRFLIAPGEDEAQVTEIMLGAIDHFCNQNGFSGCNFLFVDPQWQTLVESYGYRPWLHHSYIWQNNTNLQTFDDYLQLFNANQRRNIKRERKAIAKAGLTMKVLTGDKIPRHFYSLVYRFYSSTCDKFWGGSKYLNKKFFESLQAKYRDRVVLFTAFHEDDQDQSRPVGMSFCIRKGQNLYGRYWGCLEEYDCLHFEACYYKPIEWAIEQGITMFDPGAGGKHKRRRGFPATPNHSLHRFYDPRMATILDKYIQEINTMEHQEIEAINHDLPFTKRDIDLQ